MGKVRWLSQNLAEEEFLTRILSLEQNASREDDVELIIYSGIQREPSQELLDLVRDRSPRRRILVHLSDEKLRHRNSLYSKFDVVFRNYFDPRIAWRRNVVFLPLGWTSAFGGDPIEPKTSPSLSWSFCGASKADRKLMVNHFVNIPGGFHHFSSGWNSSDQIPAEHVRDIYSDSLFVLCPQGNAHVDTFRVMEALQAGAIPVGIRFLGRDFLRYTFGNHPFVVGDSWSDAASRVEELLVDKQRTLLYQRSVQEWYTSFLERLDKTVDSVISGAVTVAQARKIYPPVLGSRWDLVLMARVAHRFWKFRTR